MNFVLNLKAAAVSCHRQPIQCQAIASQRTLVKLSKNLQAIASQKTSQRPAAAQYYGSENLISQPSRYVGS